MTLLVAKAGISLVLLSHVVILQRGFQHWWILPARSLVWIILSFQMTFSFCCLHQPQRILMLSCVCVQRNVSFEKIFPNSLKSSLYIIPFVVAVLAFSVGSLQVVSKELLTEHWTKGKKERQGEGFVKESCWTVPRSLLCSIHQPAIFLVYIRLHEQRICGLVCSALEGCTCEQASSPCLLLHEALITAIVSGHHGLWTNGRSCRDWVRAGEGLKPKPQYSREWWKAAQ